MCVRVSEYVGVSVCEREFVCMAVWVPFWLYWILFVVCRFGVFFCNVYILCMCVFVSLFCVCL